MITEPSSAAPPSRPLTRNDYKTLSSALGGALEFYDFIIFVFFATVVGKLFFPADMPEWLRLMQTFGIFAAGYLARPLGGIVMAHFGDLLGRKKMFTLSIFMMAVPTLIMGLLPTYAQIGMWAPILLLLMRVIQGAAIGGEVPGRGCLRPSTCRRGACGLRLRHADVRADGGYFAGLAGGHGNQHALHPGRSV